MTKKKSATKRLPKKRSALLRIAVRDAMKCEKDPRFKLDMLSWVTPVGDGTCKVCMAGAVMVQRLAVGDGRVYMMFESISDLNLRGKLYDIDQMRCGEFYDENGEIDMRAAPAAKLISKHFDHDLGRAPWDIYLRAADMLEGAGL